MKNIEELVLKYALKNAWDYEGKVNANVILGAVLKEDSELKKFVPVIRETIEKISKEVAGLKRNEIEDLLRR